MKNWRIILLLLSASTSAYHMQSSSVSESPERKVNMTEYNRIQNTEYTIENVKQMGLEDEECRSCLAGNITSCKHCNLPNIEADIPLGDREVQNPLEIWEDIPTTQCTQGGCFSLCIHTDFYLGMCYSEHLCHCYGYDIHPEDTDPERLKIIYNRIPMIDCIEAVCTYSCAWHDFEKGKCLGHHVCHCYDPEDEEDEATNATEPLATKQTYSSNPNNTTELIEHEQTKLANMSTPSNPTEIINPEHISKDVPIVGCRRLTCLYTCDYLGFYHSKCRSRWTCHCKHAWRNPSMSHGEWLLKGGEFTRTIHKHNDVISITHTQEHDETMGTIKDPVENIQIDATDGHYKLIKDNGRNLPQNEDNGGFHTNENGNKTKERNPVTGENTDEESTEPIGDGRKNIKRIDGLSTNDGIKETDEITNLKKDTDGNHKQNKDSDRIIVRKNEHTRIAKHEDNIKTTEQNKGLKQNIEDNDDRVKPIGVIDKNIKQINRSGTNKQSKEFDEKPIQNEDTDGSEDLSRWGGGLEDALVPLMFDENIKQDKDTYEKLRRKGDVVKSIKRNKGIKQNEETDGNANLRNGGRVWADLLVPLKELWTDGDTDKRLGQNEDFAKNAKQNKDTAHTTKQNNDIVKDKDARVDGLVPLETLRFDENVGEYKDIDDKSEQNYDPNAKSYKQSETIVYSLRHIKLKQNQDTANTTEPNIDADDTSSTKQNKDTDKKTIQNGNSDENTNLKKGGRLLDDASVPFKGLMFDDSIKQDRDTDGKSEHIHDPGAKSYKQSEAVVYRLGHIILGQNQDTAHTNRQNKVSAHPTNVNKDTDGNAPLIVENIEHDEVADKRLGPNKDLAKSAYQNKNTSHTTKLNKDSGGRPNMNKEEDTWVDVDGLAPVMVLKFDENVKQDKYSDEKSEQNYDPNAQNDQTSEAVVDNLRHIET